MFMETQTSPLAAQAPNAGFMSEAIDQLSAALSAFQGELEQPQLNKENPYFKSRYVDLSGVLKAAQPKLAKHGLCVSQLLTGGDLVTLLSHKSGQWLKSVCPIGNYKSQQDRGSAITYTKRYAVCAILGIAADTDDDGNSATDADKKSGGMGYSSTALQAALARLEQCRNKAEVTALWEEVKKSSPALCVQGSEFYNKVAEKAVTLNCK